jgi:hypothetical protein
MPDSAQPTGSLPHQGSAGGIDRPGQRARLASLLGRLLARRWFRDRTGLSGPRASEARRGPRNDSP